MIAIQCMKAGSCFALLAASRDATLLLVLRARMDFRCRPLFSQTAPEVGPERCEAPSPSILLMHLMTMPETAKSSSRRPQRRSPVEFHPPGTVPVLARE